MWFALVLALALQQNFPMPQFPMADGVLDLAVADIDRDGRPDLLTCSYGDSDVALRRGDGWGGFGPAESFPAPDVPRGMAVGDLDGDGWLDVAMASVDAHRVFVMYGDGAGGLLPVTKYGTGEDPWDVAIGDVNNDGHPDLLVGSLYQGTISVLLALEAGGFAPASVMPTTFGAHGLVVGEVDGDGMPDLILLGSDDMSVHHGRGHGQLGPAKAYPVVAPAADLAIGDLNEDHLTDVVTTAVSGSTISVLLSDGLGGFTDTYIQAAPGNPTTAGVLILDFDEDGHADVVVMHDETQDSAGSLLNFRKGDGTGALAPAELAWVAGASALAVAADVLVDGHLDVVVAPIQSNSALLLPGDGRGHVTGLVNTDSGSSQADFGLGDADGDGVLDLALPQDSSGAAYARVLLGDGAAGFLPHWEDYPPGVPQVMRFAPLDGDGDLDLVVAHETGASIAIYAGDGSGSFGAGPVSLVSTGGPASGLVVLDADADGQLDVATSDVLADQLTLAFGHGDLSFSAPLALAVGDEPRALAAGDLTGDGLVELVSANEGDGTLTVWSPVQGVSSTHAVAQGADALALGDLDGDDALDAVVTSDAGGLSVLQGDGAGGLALRSEQELPGIAADPTLADLDGDGALDLVLADDQHRALQLLAGHGDGSFGEVTFLGVGDNPRYVEAADLDGDGLTDLATITAGFLSVHLQNAQGPFALVDGGAAGVYGVPLLKLAGGLQPLAKLTLFLQGAAPAQSVVLVAGASAALVPFKGGLLVPAVDLVLGLPPTDAAGDVQLESTWPAGLPAGTSFYVQAWVSDPAAAGGWAGSTGVSALVP